MTIPALRPWRVAALALLATGVACSDDSSSSDDTAGEDADGDTGQDDDGVPPADLPGPPDPVLAQCPDFDMGEVAMFSQTGDTSASAGQRGASCGGRGAPEHVYLWTIPADGYYQVKVDADFDAVLYLLDGGCDGQMLSCVDDVGSHDKQPFMFINGTAGTTYAIVVDGQGASPQRYGEYTIEVSPYEYLTCPSEDLGSALPVSRSYMSGEGYVMDAKCGGWYPNRVYSWTAPNDGAYKFVSTSNTLLEPQMVVSDAVCEDGNVLFCGVRSTVLPLGAGDTVSIGTRHSTAFNGMVTLDIAQYVCQPDDLGSALPAMATGSIDAAVADFEAYCGGAGGEVIHTWTAPAAGDYRFSTAGSQADTVLHVRDGAGCVGDTLACNNDVADDDATSSVLLTLTMGQTVSVVVDSAAPGLSAPYQLSITEEI